MSRKDEAAPEAAGRVRRVDLYDVGNEELAAPLELPNGFLRVEGRISRVGIQVYQLNDGSTVRELRLPEEVFDPESLASFAMMPVTNDHPQQLLDAETAKQFQVGSVGENVRPSGDFVLAPMMLTDREAIETAKRGRSQLSCGYDCEIEPTSGEWRGMKYDSIQRKIRGNHVALVDAARAGAEARIRLDRLDGVMVVSPSSAPASAPQTPEKTTMGQIRIDGMTLEVNEANVPAIQEAFDRVAKRADAAKRAAEAATKKLDAAKARMVPCDSCGGTGKVGDGDDAPMCDYCDGEGQFRMHDKYGDELNGAVENGQPATQPGADASEMEVAQTTEGEAAAAHADKAPVKQTASFKRRFALRQKVDAKKLSAGVAAAEKRALARGELLRDVEKVLGADFKRDAADLELKKLVVAKLLPAAKLDGKPAAAVDALYETALETAKAQEEARKDAAETPADAARAATTAPSTPPTRSGASAAREKMIQHHQDAWKRPAATK